MACLEIKNIQSKELYSRILRDTLRYNIPLHAYVELTSECNANCFFCFQGKWYRKKKNLSTSEWKEIFIQLKECGCFWLIFSGGEPLIREDFWELVDFVRKNRFVVSLVTNGILLKGKDIRRLKDYYIESITISIHTVDKNLSNEIYGVPYPISKVVEIVLKMQKEGLPLTIHGVLTKKNINEFEDVYSFFKRKGFPETAITFYPVHPMIGKNYVSLLPSWEDLKNFYRKHSWPIFKRSYPSLLCGAGRNVLRIDSEGNVHICPILEFPIGNLLETPLKKLWQNNFVLKLVRNIKTQDFKECIKCPYNLFCDTCMAHNRNEMGNPFVPSNYACSMARMFKEIWEEKYGRSRNS